MKKLRDLLILMSILLCVCACKHNIDGHENITFLNRSTREVAIQVQWNRSIMPEDTLFDWRGGAMYISPQSSRQNRSANDFWEIDFKVIPYIQYLIMDGSLIHKYINSPCDTIRKYVPILQRYQLTLQDLEQLHWTICYPPTEEMKNVKMWPPYHK